MESELKRKSKIPPPPLLTFNLKKRLPYFVKGDVIKVRNKV